MNLEVRGYRLNKEGKRAFISGWDVVDRDNNNTRICHIEPDGFPSMLGTTINNLVYDLNRYIREQKGEDDAWTTGIFQKISTGKQKGTQAAKE